MTILVTVRNAKEINGLKEKPPGPHYQAFCIHHFLFLKISQVGVKSYFIDETMCFI